LCPEVDIASQGKSVDEARENLREALEPFFETASPEEIKQRLHDEDYVTHVEIATASRYLIRDGDGKYGARSGHTCSS